jgi:hypothetical protein
VSFKGMKAYPVGNTPTPFSRATWFRWEAKGLIKLIRVGGRTLVSNETIDAILEGRVAIPPHPRRLGNKQVQPKKRRGRPRKHREPEGPTSQAG